jgi:hypothetical protein
MTGSLGHMTTRLIHASAERAFAYLADPEKLGRWSLGCFDTHRTEEPALRGLHVGRSLIDDSPAWFRIEADAARLTIDFLVGTPEKLVRRITVRIVPGADLDFPEATCLVSLCAWRTADMDDDRWQKLCALHEAEIFLIDGQIASTN